MPVICGRVDETGDGRAAYPWCVAVESDVTLLDSSRSKRATLIMMRNPSQQHCHVPSKKSQREIGNKCRVLLDPSFRSIALEQSPDYKQRISQILTITIGQTLCVAQYALEARYVLIPTMVLNLLRMELHRNAPVEGLGATMSQNLTPVTIYMLVQYRRSKQP